MARDINLLQFSQSLSETTLDDAYRVIQFDGNVSPLLVRQQAAFRILSQSGEAVAWGKYLNPPAALFPSALIDRPKVAFSRVGPNEYKTTWSYEMALVGSDTYDKSIHNRWPTNPAVTPGFTNLT